MAVDRNYIDSYFSQLQNDVRSGNSVLPANQIADLLANNDAGASYQELQARASGILGGNNISADRGGDIVKYNNDFWAAGPADVDSAARQRSADFLAASQALDLQEGRIDPQLGVAKANIMDQFNAAINTLLGQKDRATRDFATATDRTKQDNQSAKAKIDQNVGQTNTGIQRLLGSRGAGNSSAASILAPYAAGAVGNTQRGDVQRVYGRNMQDIDTKQGDFLQDWEIKKGQVESDRTNRNNEADSAAAQARLNIAQQRQALNPYNASTYNGQIADLISKIDSLARVNTYVPPTAAYRAPELTPYGYRSAVAPGTTGVSDQAQNNVGPYWTLLGEDQRKDQMA